MADKAQVGSVEALESFRSNLINYVSKARPTLEGASADAVRCRLWLQNEQRLHLENLVRRRGRELETAQQALSGARMASQSKDTTPEQNAVRRARQNLEAADGKLRTLKKWNREFDSRVGPLVKELEKLHTLLANDMPKGVIYLTQAINTLAAYAELNPAAGTTPPTSAGKTDESATSPAEPDNAGSGAKNPGAPGVPKAS